MLSSSLEALLKQLKSNIYVESDVIITLRQF